MKFPDKLEKRLAFLAVPNVILFVVLGQILAFGLILAGRASMGSLLLVPAAVLENGEAWRLITFVLCPPFVPGSVVGMLFLGFYWYIFWLAGGALEQAWGLVRLNAYLLLGVIFTILGAFAGQFISPETLIVSNPKFLYLSVFLAFATLNPNFEFLLFFVLPVKVKWLAWLAGGVTVFSGFAAGSIGGCLSVLAPLANYFLFFRGDFVRLFQARKRRAKFEAQRKATAEAAFHTCDACGATDRSHPEREFRYKTVDGETVCLCEACREP